MSRQPGDLRPGPSGENPRQNRPFGAGGPGQEPTFRWAMIALFLLVVAVLVLPSLLGGSTAAQLGYGDLIRRANEGKVAKASVNNDTGQIEG